MKSIASRYGAFVTVVVDEAGVVERGRVKE
jgi:hypothetical protein